MKGRKKRLLSQLLAGVMVFSLLPVTAWAEDTGSGNGDSGQTIADNDKTIDDITYAYGGGIPETGLNHTTDTPEVPTWYLAGDSEDNYILYTPADDTTPQTYVLHDAAVLLEGISEKKPDGSTVSYPVYGISMNGDSANIILEGTNIIAADYCLVDKNGSINISGDGSLSLKKAENSNLDHTFFGIQAGAVIIDGTTVSLTGMDIRVAQSLMLKNKAVLRSDTDTQENLESIEIQSDDNGKITVDDSNLEIKSGQFGIYFLGEGTHTFEVVNHSTVSISVTGNGTYLDEKTNVKAVFEDSDITIFTDGTHGSVPGMGLYNGRANCSTSIDNCTVDITASEWAIGANPIIKNSTVTARAIGTSDGTYYTGASYGVAGRATIENSTVIMEGQTQAAVQTAINGECVYILAGDSEATATKADSVGNAKYAKVIAAPTHTYSSSTDATCDVCGAVREIREYTVTFDANGGNVTPTSAATVDGKLSALPTPTRSGYRFRGWFTADGTEVTTDTVFAADTTISASWKKKSSSSSSDRTYSTKAEDTKNGDIRISPSNAEKGDTVTVTVKPDAGYEWKNLSVTDKNDEELKLKEIDENKFTFTMPASNVTVDVDFVRIEEKEPEKEPETKPEPEQVSFADVKDGDWFADAVAFVAEKGIMGGTGDDCFSPELPITRGMLVTILHRMEGAPAPEQVSPFLDVTSNQYYAKAVAWGFENDVVSGLDAETFAPNQNITREQLAAILYRYAQLKGYDVSVGEDTNILSYADAASVSAYAIPAVQWACGAGLMNGMDGALHPQDSATRAQTAMILMHFYEATGK